MRHEENDPIMTTDDLAVKCPVCGYNLTAHKWPNRIHIRMVLIRDELERMFEQMEDCEW